MAVQAHRLVEALLHDGETFPWVTTQARESLSCRSDVERISAGASAQILPTQRHGDGRTCACPQGE
jgi:hypothetical protein